MIRRSYLLAGSLVAGLALPTTARFSVVPALMLGLGAVALAPRITVACLLAVVGWWWGSMRLHELDASRLAGLVGSGGIGGG